MFALGGNGELIDCAHASTCMRMLGKLLIGASHDSVMCNAHILMPHAHWFYRCFEHSKVLPSDKEQIKNRSRVEQKSCFPMFGCCSHTQNNDHQEMDSNLK